MMHKTCALIVSITAASCFAEPIVLHAHDRNNNLFTVDVQTGLAELVTTTPQQYFDIAFDESGTLFGVSSTGDLRTIDPLTGQTTLIGPSGTGPNALVFAPDGTLYAAANTSLFSVNTQTGQATETVSFGPNQSAGDLAFDTTGNLFLTTTAGDLLRIDLTSGTATTVGNTGHVDVLGLARGPNGNMFGLTASNELLAVDTTDGSTTVIAPITGSFDLSATFGSSFTTETILPEPASAALFLLAAALLLATPLATRLLGK